MLMCCVNIWGMCFHRLAVGLTLFSIAFFLSIPNDMPVFSHQFN